MSKSIFDGSNSIIGANEELSRYVKRVMADKKLSLRDVQRRSGDRITQGYVGAIVKGKYGNPTIQKLKALARGLGVDEEEVFRVARGASRAEKAKQGRDPGEVLEVLDLMKEVAQNAIVKTILEELVKLPPNPQKVVLKTVQDLKDAEEDDAPERQAI
jgi:transcriptional regulator with XRE-family HTH domain